MKHTLCLFAFVAAVLPASVWAGDVGLGPAADAVVPTEDAEFSLAPGLGLTGRYAFSSRHDRAFLEFDATASWLRYDDPFLPELLVRTRAAWGWRLGWRVPLDISAGFTFAFPPKVTPDREVRFNRVVPLPTISVGTAYQGDGWEVFARVRLETFVPSASIGVLCW